MPAFTPFSAGGGPIVPASFIRSFSSPSRAARSPVFTRSISSGTTPKMIAKETDTRMIGYGSMLMEGVVGIVALIAATSLFPGDYFAINTPQTTDAQKAAYVRMIDKHSSTQVQSATAGDRSTRSRNQVRRICAAAPAAQSRSHSASQRSSDGIPGLSGFMKYWYHFAIMFEALFILTTIDTGTRVARFLVGEFGGRFYTKTRRAKLAARVRLSPAPLVVASVGGVHLVADRSRRFGRCSELRINCLRRSRCASPRRSSSTWAKRAICLGNDRAAHLRRHHHTRRRLSIHSRHLLATGPESAHLDAGLHQHFIDRADYDRRRDRPG